MTRPARWLLLSLLAVPAWSAQAAWGGAANQAWSDAAGWGGQPPAAGDELVLAGSGRNDLPAQVVFAGLIARGDARVTGGELALAGRIAVERGTLLLACPLSAAGPLTVTVAKDARLVIAAPFAAHAFALEFTGEGEVEVAAPIAGEGAVRAAVGHLVLAADSPFTGAVALAGGCVRLARDCVPGADGALGRGEAAIALDGGVRVEFAAGRCERALAVGAGGARLVAVGGARTVASAITGAGWSAGGIVGSYVAAPLRAISEDDWRATRAIAGTRVDRLVHFPQPAFGTAAERRAWRIAGSDTDWESFSVQWDGWLRVLATCDLATFSDDGSRVWLDRDGDGAIGAGEWGSNGWGMPHGAAAAAVHRAIAPGIYRIRIQYEEGGGGDAMSLLWSDAAHSAGPFAGLQLVPADAFVRPASLDLAAEADAALTLTGAITGHGVVAAGGGAVTIAGRVDPGIRLAAEAGELVVAGAALAQPATLVVARGATLRLAGDAQVAGLAGAGDLVLDGVATIAVPRGSTTRFAGGIAGNGGVRLTGGGALALAGATAWTGITAVDDGSLELVASGRRRRGVVLQAPLTTVAALADLAPAGGIELEADIEVPADAPEDLGVGAFIGDLHGRWWQQCRAGALAPGRNHVVFALGPDRPLAPEAQRGDWSAAAAATATRAGLFFWSQHPSRARLGIETRVRAAVAATGTHRLIDLAPDAVADGAARGRTGERWQATCRVAPMPANPFDADDFRLDAVFTHESGAIQRVPGFWLQPMRSRDRGDEEELTPDGEGRFAVRFRPRQPGRWRVAFEAAWRGGATRRVELPPLVVDGPRWDGYVRVDARDHRFFSLDGGFWWPIGLNLRSVNDPRGRDCLGSKLTPDRGALSYAAYLARLAAGGGNACEIWMAPWNLAIEWRADWRGFHGQGRYSDENAWKLDEVLDAAWRHGVRVNLVVHNHGQGSDGTDHEWEDSPYNAAAGGRLASATAFFADPWALAGQENHRRYLVARWADHPAILGWKLWSEVNLTAAGPLVVGWHERATARWHALDGYGHPLTTHWAGDYHAPHPAVCALPGLDYLCIDAYHSNGAVAKLVCDSVVDPDAGLKRYAKPVLITEYGGSPGAGPVAQIAAELASAPWAALTAGCAGAPMLWWYEWVDQGGRWQSYGAIGRFIAGEDLRGPEAASIALATASDAGGLWSRAWFRPGRVLGYVLDRRWGASGQAATRHERATVEVGREVAAGAMRLQWWDADRGEPLGEPLAIAHPGGALVLSAPPFERHLAFKLWRVEAAR